MRLYACRGVCLCPDLVIMAALAAMYLESALSPCHRPSPIWHHELMAAERVQSGHRTSSWDVLVLCRYLIPHFTSSDFTMHEQSEFKERSLVMHWALHNFPAGHTCALLPLHSCNQKSPRWFCSVPMNHLSEFFQQTDDSQVPCTSIRTRYCQAPRSTR